MPDPVPSLPPDAKKASIWAHTIIDALAIVAITVLICLDKIPVEWGVAIIALIAGVWARMQKGGARIPPAGGLVLGLLEGALDAVGWLRQ